MAIASPFREFPASGPTRASYILAPLGLVTFARSANSLQYFQQQMFGCTSPLVIGLTLLPSMPSDQAAFLTTSKKQLLPYTYTHQCNAWLPILGQFESNLSPKKTLIAGLRLEQQPAWLSLKSRRRPVPAAPACAAFALTMRHHCCGQLFHCSTLLLIAVCFTELSSVLHCLHYCSVQCTQLY